MSVTFSSAQTSTCKFTVYILEFYSDSLAKDTLINAAIGDTVYAEIFFSGDTGTYENQCSFVNIYVTAFGPKRLDTLSFKEVKRKNTSRGVYLVPFVLLPSIGCFDYEFARKITFSNSNQTTVNPYSTKEVTIKPCKQTVASITNGIGQDKNCKVSVYDLQGNLIKEGTGADYQNDLSENTLYLYQATFQDNSIERGKFVVQK